MRLPSETLAPLNDVDTEIELIYGEAHNGAIHANRIRDCCHPYSGPLPAA